MIRLFGVFAFILGAVWGILSLLDPRSDYIAEKILWQATQRLSFASKNPEAVPDRDFEQIAAQYQKVIKDFPNSRLVPSAYFFLGNLYSVKKDYETARGMLGEICPKYPGNASLCSEASANIAKTFELEGNWSEALKVYQGIEKAYPLSDLGLTIPLYIANYYARYSHTVNAQEAFAEAAAHYRKLSAEHPNSEVELKALKLLSGCYLVQKNWKEATAALAEILNKYPNSQLVVPTSQAIDSITLTESKDFDAAITIYRDFIAKNPKHPLEKHFQETIQTFEKLKSKKTSETETRKS